MTCPHCGAANDAAALACFTCGGVLSAAATIRKGSLVASRYEILEFLGKGGMGMVYKAHDRILEEDVALKVLRSDVAQEQDMARRFRQEIKLARRVRHRNVCGIHEYGEDGDLRFIAMEYIEGVDLRRLLREQGAPSTEEAFEISIQVTEGLQAIHEAGIIHRDLKTPNIMRDSRGFVRLMDFGIAKQHGAEITLGGIVVGTPEYMSPEQARGEKVDFRSDIYAVGIVIYEIFTGDVPFRGETPVATIYKQLHESPPFESSKAARLPRRLIPVLARVLAKRPDERYHTVQELVEALREARAAESLPVAPTRGATALQPEPVPLPTPTPVPALQPTPVPASVQTDVHTAPDFAAASGTETPAPTPVHEPTPMPASVATDVHAAESPLAGQAAAPPTTAPMEAQARLEETQRLQAESEACRRIEDRLSHGAIEEAVAAVEEARAFLGEMEVLTAFRLRIEEMRRRGALAEHLSQAEALVASERLEEAEAELSEVLRLEAHHPAATGLLEELGRRHAEDARRDALAAAAAAVGGLLAKGDLARAGEALAKAQAAFGNPGPLEELEARLHEASREAALRQILTDAEALLASGNLHEARQAVREALDRSPQNQRARALSQHVEERLRAQAASATAVRIQELLRQRSLDEARAELVRAEEALGDDLRFKALREELQRLRDLERKESVPVAVPEAIRRKAPTRGSYAKVVAAGASVIILGLVVLWRLQRPSPESGPPPSLVTAPIPTAAVVPAEVKASATPEPAAVSAPTGVVIIDALPWGEVSEIVDGNGKAQPLPSERVTPLRLSLPEGEYLVSLTKPGSARPMTLRVSVQASQVTRRVAEFRRIDAREYLKKAGL